MKTILEQLHYQICCNPDRIAISCEGRNYTYLEIGSIISKITSDILSVKDRCNSNIAILTKRSELSILMSIAIMNAGFAFVPLDENLPEERINIICKKAKIKIVLGDIQTINEKLRSTDNYIYLKYAISDLDSLKNTIYKKCDEVKIDSSSPAVIVFTSGSTGEPKGVIHSHECLYICNTIDACRHSLSENDNVLSVLNFCYAFSLQVFQPFMVGATLHIATDIIRTDLFLIYEYIESNSISVATMPTQMGYLFCTTYKTTKMRLLIVGGGVLPKLSHLPNFKLISNYGCSECIFAAYQEITKESDFSNIGIPSDYLSFKIINKDGNEVGINQSGELWIAGSTVAIGYLDLPDQTNKKFVYNEGKIWCRTGDEVRRTEKDEYKYVGRLDGMVKLRNQRIEITEIEYWISSIPCIRQVCVCLKDINNSPRLCAYYVSEDGETKEIEEELRKHIPDYMIPSFYILMDSIPVNSNGKFDKNNLPNPKIEKNGTIKPRTKEEHMIINCVSEILSIDSIVYMDDNFKDLGGDSLDALKLCAMLREHGFSISMTEVLKSNSLSAIVEMLKRSNEEDVTQQVTFLKGFACPPAINHMIRNNTVDSINGFIIPEFFKCNIRTTIETVKTVLYSLLNCHEMLRAHIEKGKFYIKDVSDDRLCHIEEKTIPSVIDNDCGINMIVNELYSHINIFKGPAIATLLLHCSDADYILIACSHLISDSYSKSILKRDFINIFTQLSNKEAIVLPVKSDSYVGYCNNLACKSLMKLDDNFKIVEQGYLPIFETQLIRIDEESSKNMESCLRNNGLEVSSYIVSCIIYVLKVTLQITTKNFLIYRHGRDIAVNDVKHSFDKTLGYFPMCYCVDVSSCSYVSFNRILDDVNKHYYINQDIDYYSIDNKGINVPTFGFNYLGELRESTNCHNDFLETDTTIPKGTYNPKKLNMGTPFTFFMIKRNGSFIFQLRYNTKEYSETNIKVVSERLKTILIEFLKNMRKLAPATHSLT